MKMLRTFVVEDSPVIRQNLVSTLEELAPVQVVGCAESQQDAVDQLVAPQLDCDLVIVDIVLKAGTGFGVLGEPAARRGDRQFVVLTNYATPEVRSRCIQLGVNRVFDKSNDIDALVDYCQQLAEGASPPRAAPSIG